MPVFATLPAPFTVRYLMDRTFDLLLGASREERNQLNANLDSATTNFAVNFTLGALQRGTYLTIDDETMYVWSSSSASGVSSTVTVERGDKGTTAVPHSAGAIISVDPYFSRYAVRETLRDEIRSWGPQVFQVKTADVTADNFVRGYDLGNIGEWFYILGVTESPDTMAGVKADNAWNEVSYKVVKSANTTAFPSGNALMITDPLGVFDVPRTFHIVFAAPIDVDTTFGDDDPLGTMGIDSSELDIPPYGAAWRLASSREIRRMLTEAQGQNSDLTNFPAGYQLKAAEGFKQLRDSRLGDAVARLRSQYPVRVA